MTARANWTGTLRIAELTCPVALYAAASTPEHIALHMQNRKTGNRVRHGRVNSATAKPVDRGHQIKGYELPGGEHVVLPPEEIATALPDSDKVLQVKPFVACDGIGLTFIDRLNDRPAQAPWRKAG